MFQSTNKYIYIYSYIYIYIILFHSISFYFILFHLFLSSAFWTPPLASPSRCVVFLSSPSPRCGEGPRPRHANSAGCSPRRSPGPSDQRSSWPSRPVRPVRPPFEWPSHGMLNEGDTLWWTNIAIENGHRNSGFSQLENGDLPLLCDSSPEGMFGKNTLGNWM